MVERVVVEVPIVPRSHFEQNFPRYQGAWVGFSRLKKTDPKKLSPISFKVYKSIDPVESFSKTTLLTSSKV